MSRKGFGGGGTLGGLRGGCRKNKSIDLWTKAMAAANDIILLSSRHTGRLRGGGCQPKGNVSRNDWKLEQNEWPRDGHHQVDLGWPLGFGNDKLQVGCEFGGGD